MPEHGEPERRVQTPGGRLFVADGEDDLFQTRERLGTMQRLAHQLSRNALSPMFRMHKDSPDFALVPLLAARVASESHGADQFAAGKCTHYETVFAGR